MNSYYFYSLIVLSIIINIGFGIVVPVMPIIIGSEAGVSIIGIPFISLVIGRVFSKKITSILIKRGFGKSVLSLCFILYGVTFLLYSIEVNIYLISIYRFFEGVIEGVVVICLTALAIEATSNDPKRGRKMGLFGASFGLGMILGPVIGSYIYSEYHYSYVFTFAALTGFLGFIISLILSNYFEIKNTKDGRVLFGDGLFEELKLVGVYIPSIIRRLTLFSCLLIAPVYLVEVLGGDIKDVGLMFSISGFISTILMPFTGMLADKFDALKLSSMSILAMGLCFLMMAIVDDLDLFIVIFCIETLLFSIMLPAGLKQFGDVVDNFGERASIVGRFSLYTEFSTILMAVFVSFVIGIDSRFSWVAVSIVCMVCSIIYYVCVCNLKRDIKF